LSRWAPFGKCRIAAAGRRGEEEGGRQLRRVSRVWTAGSGEAGKAGARTKEEVSRAGFIDRDSLWVRP